MAQKLDEAAQSFRSLSKADAISRLKTASDKMFQIFDVQRVSTPAGVRGLVERVHPEVDLSRRESVRHEHGVGIGGDDIETLLAQHSMEIVKRRGLMPNFSGSMSERTDASVAS